jgi:short chain dehydrogenase
MAGIQIPSCTQCRGFSSFCRANSDMRLRNRWPKRLLMLNLARPKRPRLHLDSEQYNQLRQEILQRDGWRGQLSGTRSNLVIHHQEFRSQCGGIGESTAKLLAERGAKVVLGARRSNRIDAVVQEISASGGKAIGFATDVTKRAEVEALIQGARRRFRPRRCAPE